MDYSKKDGGTRVHDQGVARSLATGIGQSYAAMRANGSGRAQRVAAGMKPGQHVSDRGLAQLHSEHEAMGVGLDPDSIPVPKRFPMETGRMSHTEANGMFTAPGQKVDQGEVHRRPTTARDQRVGQVTTAVAK
jgi:hypothetical protein